MGTEMSNVVTVNTLAMRGSMPATNWWCAHTKKLRTPVATAVYNMILYPKSFFRAKVATISLTIPMAGRSTTYTSGCPKNQKRCCQRMGSLPRSGS